MRPVMFRFKPGVPLDRQKAVLEDIGRWREVDRASRLKPNAKHPEVLRMCYAYVTDPTNVRTTLRRLEDLPEVESASEPAERLLA